MPRGGRRPRAAICQHRGKDGSFILARQAAETAHSKTLTRAPRRQDSRIRRGYTHRRWKASRRFTSRTARRDSSRYPVASCSCGDRGLEIPIRGNRVGLLILPLTALRAPSPLGGERDGVRGAHVNPSAHPDPSVRLRSSGLGSPARWSFFIPNARVRLFWASG